jgi:hypothetical protein
LDSKPPAKPLEVIISLPLFLFSSFVIPHSHASHLHRRRRHVTFIVIVDNDDNEHLHITFVALSISPVLITIIF